MVAFIITTMSSLVLLVLTSTTAQAASSGLTSGLTLTVWDNNGREGAPVLTKVIPTMHYDFASATELLNISSNNPTGAFSADIEGTIEFTTSGVFEFYCNFTRFATAFVWVDGHMVCQGGESKPFKVDPTVMDNPLPVQGMDTGTNSKILPFRAHLMYNGATARSPCDPATVEPTALGCFNDTAHQCGYKQQGSDKENSWHKAAVTCDAAGAAFAGAEDGKGIEIWCGATAPSCPKLPEASCGKPCPGDPSKTCGNAWALQALAYTCTRPTPYTEPPTVNVQWSPWNGNKPSGTPVAIPTAILGAALPLYEQERETLQRGLATGWGPWLHSNMLALVSLPSCGTVTTSICKKGSSATADCIDSAQPDGHKQNARSAYVRVGHHAYDRSYVQFFVAHSTADSLPVGVNASIEYTVSNGGKDIDILVSPVDGGSSDWKDVELVLDTRFAFFRAGTVAADAATDGESKGSPSVTLTPAGLPSFTLTSTAGVTGASSPSDGSLRVSLSDGPVGFTTSMEGGTVTVAGIQRKLAAAAGMEVALLNATFGETYAGHGMAIKGSAMWNLIYNPAENGAALLPVSRDWNFAPGPANDDWTYAIFDWDNIFASLLAGLGNKTIAYSNLIQVIKSKTAAGFVPNYAAGGSKSMDRTEPPVGAKTLLQLYEKYKDMWVVELLFDDLLDWSNWFMRRRLLPPLDLVALGSFNEEADITGSFANQNMQNARYESGLDNSPMYDGEFYDSSNTFLMQLYDVGMSSMVVQEAYALATLADAIGRPEGAMLRARGDGLGELIGAYLWDEESQNYVNKFVNNSFYRRISPTSFYALQTKAPTDAQATAMMEKWLMSPDHFCVSDTGDFKGNNDTCYWGLPSIQASDPAFPPLGYWRGYVWGPMAQLTHWSLQNYDHVPAVRKGRKALAKQMGSLMMSQWDQHRHICENYNPHKTADTSGGDCSGTKFYHWGALTGLIELVEEGFWK